MYEHIIVSPLIVRSLKGRPLHVRPLDVRPQNVRRLDVTPLDVRSVYEDPWNIRFLLCSTAGRNTPGCKTPGGTTRAKF